MFYSSSLLTLAEGDEVSLPPRLEDLLLGTKPVLFVLSGFTTAAFIQLVGSVPYPVLR